MDQMDKPPLILVADDDRGTRLVMKTAMAQNGFDVAEAENGEAAVGLFDKLRPDLVLLDVVMPLMDGFEACRQLRRHPQGASVPIVIITATEDIEAIREAYEAGATDFIAKPFNRIVLRERVRYMLRASSTARQLHQSRELLARAQTTARLGSFSYRPGAAILQVSDEFRRIFALPAMPQEAPVQTDAFQTVAWDALWQQIHPQDRESLAPLLREAQSSGTGFREDIRIAGGWPENRFAMLQIDAETESDGTVLRLTGIAQDITERKLAELLESDQNQILQRIARKEPLEKIFNKIAGLLERQWPRSAGVLSRVEEGGVQGIFAPGLPDGYLQAMRHIPLSTENGTCAAAAALGQPAMATDVATSIFWRSLRGTALDNGIRSSVAVPIFSGTGQVLGTVGLIRRHVRQTTSAELGLLKRIANLAALAMEQHHLAQRLVYQAQHDPLTGLTNRAALNSWFAQILKQITRMPAPGAYMLLDLNRFKQVNDSMGHPLGDRLLQAVADRLRESVRDSDILSRVGGDEFVLVMPEIQDENDAVRAAGRILDAFKVPFAVDSRNLQMDVSIGITLFPQDGSDPTELHRNADIAMYVAKNKGGSRFHLFDAEMQEAVVQRLQMENDLRKAMERDEFELHYQPQLDLISNRLVVLEALIRWNHPQRGRIPAERFISVAEESRLIIPIGRWVLAEACRQSMAWQAEGLPPIRVAVNASAVQFSETDFAEIVQEILDQTGLDPCLLEIEITETVVLKDLEKACSNLQRLKDMGVTTTLDDFGTGYSSITYLRRMPLDCLKIDKSFIRDLEIVPGRKDCRNTNFVQAFATLARNLNLHLVAEGIETEAQSRVLKELGYTIGQGFLFSVPLSASGAAQLMEKFR
jgi:diguanylate cyclase (GGDEF)-like protein